MSRVANTIFTFTLIVLSIVTLLIGSAVSDHENWLPFECPEDEQERACVASGFLTRFAISLMLYQLLMLLLKIKSYEGSDYVGPIHSAAWTASK